MNNQDKKTVKNLIFIGSIFLILPITLYILNFWSLPISKSGEDWNQFGGYFGGVTNTIISLFSLIILGYITFQISKFSAEENKKNNLMVRRLDAYNEITRFLPKLSYSLSTLIRKVMVTFKNLDENNDFNNADFKKGVQEILTELDTFIQFHFELIHFPTRFGHLFKYDFSQSEFQVLKKNSQSIRVKLQKLMEEIETSKGALDYPDQLMLDFLAQLLSFFEQLELELK